MMYKILFIIGLMSLVSSCASITGKQLREDPAGVYSFKVNGNYKTAYDKALLHARSCYELKAAGNTFVVKGSESPENRKSSLSIARVRALSDETVFIVDIAQTDDANTEVKVYYAQLRYKTAAMTVEDWINKDSNACNMGKVILECVCFLVDQH